MEQLIINTPLVFFAFFIFCFSAFMSDRMIPKLIQVIRFKNLMDNPNNRSSHVNNTPTLAGLVFYISLVMNLFLIHYIDTVDVIINIITGLTILLIIGLKDDLTVLSAKTKVIAQIVSISIILLNSDLYITNLNGFLGIYEIPFLVSIVLSYLFIIFIINAYNLIDGIDGLAGMLGIVIFVVFAFFFYKLGLNVYFLLSILSIGFLVSFLRYNLSDTNKIFMGDTGSMIIGFLIGILTLRFLAIDANQFQKIFILPENSFIIILSILFFPVIDVLRILIIRFTNKTGLFTPDRRHLHHVFIDKGLPHKIASITITISSIISFLIVYLINTYLSYIGLLLVFMFITLISYYLLMLLDINSTTRERRKKIKSYIPKVIYMLEFRLRKRIIIFLKKVFYKDLL